jgi:hypothetical protein
MVTLGIITDEAVRTVGLQGGSDWVNRPWQAQVAPPGETGPAWKNVPNAPNDFQLAVTRSLRRGEYYLPVTNGWVVGQPLGPIVPYPNPGTNLAVREGGHLGSAAAIAALTGEADTAVQTLTKIQRTQLWLQVITTVSFVVLAGVTIFNTVQTQRTRKKEGR